MKVLKAAGIGFLGFLLLVAVVAVAARFNDGPIAMLPGGPLTSGEWVEGGRIDWTFANDVKEIEFESGGRSRTSWILVHEGEAYIPCSVKFPPGKTWYKEIPERPEAVLRVEGKRYKRNLVRVEDEALHASLSEVAGSKYTAPPGGRENSIFFHVTPR